MHSGSKIKILLVNFSSRGGLAHHIYFLCDALSRQEAEFMLLTTRDFELASLCKHLPCKLKLFSHIHYRWMAFKTLVYCFSLFRVYLEVRKSRPEILHLQEMRIPLLEKWLYRAAQKQGTRVVFTVHDLVNTDKEKHETALAHIYQYFDHVIVHTDANRQIVEQEFGVPAERVTVLPVGEYTALPGAILDQASAREKIGIEAESQVALFFGYIRKYKGLNLLLEAFRQLAERMPKLVLIVAGEPKDAIESYKQFIATNGLDGRVVWDPRYIPLEKMSEYFSAADIVVLPYRRVYQSGLVRLAYAHQKPVIATRVGDLPTVVEEGQSGYLVAPDSADALRDALRQAFSDPDKLQQMGAYGFTRMSEKFSWSMIAEQHRAIYCKMRK